ncbi:MAG: L-aspartate oxidase [Cyanobacteria bacterium J06635_15]
MVSDFSSFLPSAVDVIVIGSGAAGLYAALSLPEELQVGIITKNSLQTGSSSWAQGGVAAAIDPSDSPQLHLEDTLKAGAGLCEVDAVQLLVDEAAVSIESLLSLGVAFDRKGNTLEKTLEAAHSRPRVLHSADTTGRAIVDIFIARVQERSNIHVFSEALALNLWRHPETGICQGVSLLYQRQIHWLKAEAVVLATGGGGQVFSQTTNPSVSTGDGVAMAWRAGAVLRDLEFFQFHPTALTVPGAPRFLISEAVRGEGAHLVDAQGDRFAFDYHPSGELAPRDVVSRAIFSHLQKTEPDATDAHVYLNLTPISPEQVRYRFPKIIEVCQQWGIDVFQQPIPVAPAAHYWMGGVAVDLNSQTSIPGLYAIGETASTGVHGANRLASNSLLECLVFARQLAQIKPDGSLQDAVAPADPPKIVREIENLEYQCHRLEVIREALPNLVWQTAGVYRTGEALASGIAQVEAWQTEVASFEISHGLRDATPNQSIQFDASVTERELILAVETCNLVDVAALTLKSAAFRTESRGGHYRVDYPQSSPEWVVHTLVEGAAFGTAAVNAEVSESDQIAS